MAANLNKIFLIIILSLVVFLLISSKENKNNNIKLINNSITRGLNFIDNSANDKGIFKSLVCETDKMEKCIKDNSVFISHFIFYSLNNPQTNYAISNKSISFILDQMSENRTWNYYINRSGNIPDDIDDTVVSLISIFISNVSFDYNLEFIEKNFENEKGIFNTWFHPPFENNIDCVINSNVLLYYYLLNKSNSNIENYLNDIILNKKYPSCSKYYPNELVFIFAVSRAYEHDSFNNLKIRPLIEYLLNIQKKNGSWGDDFNTTLASLSLLHFGYKCKEIENAITFLFKTQNEDGSWDIGNFFTDASNKHYGSGVLTTAFAIETMSKYVSIKQHL